MSIGITLRFSAVLAIFAILASGLTGYYAYDDNRRLLLAHSERSLQNGMQIIGQQLLVALNNTAKDVRLLASQANISGGPGAPIQTDGILQAARSLMQVHPEYLHVSLIDARRDWREIARIGREGSNLHQITYPDDSLQTYLNPVLHLTPGQVYLSETFALDVDCEACEGETDVAGKETDRQISFLVSAPVARENGMNSNILVAIRVDLTFFARSIGASLPPAFQFGIADSEGSLVYVSQNSSGWLDWEGKPLQALFPAASAVVKGDQDTLVYNDLLSQNDLENARLTAFKRVQSMDFSNGRYFIMAISEPLLQVLQDIRLLWENMWQIVLSFSLIAVFLAWMVSQAITRPLARILTSVQHFAAGESSSDILLPVRSRGDEIGLLAAGVEKMQNQIRTQLEALEENHQAMQHMAHHDSLTGLANRLTLFRLMENVIAQARRQGYKFAVLFVDLDYFKEVNDKYGHYIGDQLLITVARCLQAGVRESDIVARLAGDEFVVILSPIHNGVEAELVGKKLLQRLNNPLTITEEGKKVHISICASIGISMYPAHGETPQELVDIADEAMYASKSSGRNTCTLVNLEGKTGQGAAQGAGKGSEKPDSA
ncbi:MAG: diguanylate cyclase [Betaproteobacteria bacterium]|nr:diguanylate cyclase [Betaproteobacteria bacterium]